MKVAILGSSGMLGSMLKNTFEDEVEVIRKLVPLDRSSLDIWPRKLGSLGERLSSLIGYDVDYVVNCVGATKPYFDTVDPHVPLYVNAVFPHQLATWCDLTKTKLIHITTDCVYAGDKSYYTESFIADATDLYGRSKALGESPMAMNLRTSIIGFENGRRRHLLEWVRSQNNKEIKGFTDHFWNGLTTLELARCIFDIIDSDVHEPGTYHVFSNTVSKYELVSMIIDAYDLNIDVVPVKTSRPINRTLSTVEELNSWLEPQSTSAMLDELVVCEEWFKECGKI